MQDIIKLKLVDLGYNKKGYSLTRKMNWLDAKNNIIFITIPELINFNIFLRFTCNFLVPCIINYKDYLKIKKQYGGLPISLDKYEIKYSKWLESINFYNFIDQNKIEINISQGYWSISPYNYSSIKKIDFKSEKELIKKSIKIRKLKI